MDKIEIPFGAYDSETLGWTYTIPKGYTAKIEDGKIIVKKEETEDEKIRKKLIKTIGYFRSRGIDQQLCEEFLAWLEKQKEQIPYTDFVIKPHKGDDNNPYDMGFSEAQEYATKRGFGVPFIDGEVYVDERHIIQTVGNIIRWADEHPKEQKPAEWGDEDEAALISILYCISQAIKNVNDENERNSLLNAKSWIQDKLKFHIPSRISHPRPSWKPSEEQIQGLAHAINLDVYDAQRYKLDILYNDLKKLM